MTKAGILAHDAAHCHSRIARNVYLIENKISLITKEDLLKRLNIIKEENGKLQSIVDELYKIKTKIANND